MRIIGPNEKAVILPALLIPAIIILSALTAVRGYRQVDAKIGELKKIEADDGVLKKKLLILRKIRSNVLEKTNNAVLALPEKSPITYVVSLIKTYSGEESILIEKLSMRSSERTSKEVNVSDFDLKTLITDSKDHISSAIKFLDLLSVSIPLTSFKEIKISGKEGVFDFSVNGYVYNSPLPTELPPLTKPIKELTDSEELLIEKISGMSKPQFPVLEPTEPEESRQSPFLSPD